MSNISINELNPRASKFLLRGKEYPLKKFTLAAQVWAHSEFATKEEPNGLVNLSTKLVELDSGAIAKSCYFLLEDKTDFPTEDSFLDSLGDNFTVIKVLLAPFSECLGVSQPSSEETELEVELKK